MSNTQPKYWVACSGGLDSVALTRILYEANISIGILHMNFQLRGADSDQDEYFVAALADELNIPFRSKKVDTQAYKTKHKVNTQLAARNLRYNWFNELITQEEIVICLAHHADDQIENFFIQLERGAGIRGLAGMRNYKNHFFRPLLNVTKKELKEIAIKNQWTWREDQSNFESIYKRNWYRIHFLPTILRSVENRSLITNLVMNYQQADDFLAAVRDNTAHTSENTFQWSDWNNFPYVFQHELLRSWGVNIGQLPEINRLQKGEKGGKLQYDTITIWNEGDCFFVERKADMIDSTPRLEERMVKRHEVHFTADKIYVDKVKLRGSLFLSHWEQGDRFQPLGMKGTKLVSDFLIDRKVPARKKQHTLVVKDEQGIIAIIGFGPSERVKIDAQTENILCFWLEKD